MTPKISFRLVTLLPYQGYSKWLLLGGLIDIVSGIINMMKEKKLIADVAIIWFFEWIR